MSLKCSYTASWKWKPDTMLHARSPTQSVLQGDETLLQGWTIMKAIHSPFPPQTNLFSLDPEATEQSIKSHCVCDNEDRIYSRNAQEQSTRIICPTVSTAELINISSMRVIDILALDMATTNYILLSCTVFNYAAWDHLSFTSFPVKMYINFIYQWKKQLIYQFTSTIIQKKGSV